jgi:hypothetical protein
MLVVQGEGRYAYIGLHIKCAYPVYMFMNSNVSVLMLLIYVLQQSARSERIVLNSQRPISVLYARCPVDFCGT